MKTKEEIEKLANKEYPVKRGGPMWMQNTDDNKRYYKQEGYIKGYTQCQLDMADKKYTEEDIKEAAYFFVSKKLAANQSVLDEEIQDFINSLNKQD